MSNVSKVFGTNKTLEKEGIMLDYGEFAVRVARAGGSNKAFSTLFERLTKPHRRAMETNTMSEETMKDIMYEVYAKTVVLDWAGINDDEGKPVQYSAEECIKLFREAPDFYANLSEAASTFNMFQEEQAEQDEKN